MTTTERAVAKIERERERETKTKRVLNLGN